jgi:two-component system, NarL family, nitrate/nitrite response regulator NarL
MVRMQRTDQRGLTSTSQRPVYVVTIVGVRLYRDGLERALAGADAVRLVGSAADVDAAEPVIRREAPDVVLLDVAAGDAAIRQVRATAPGAAVVALAIAEDEHDVIPLAEAGVAGYVSRDASVTELLNAIVRVARGDTVCSPRVAGLLVQRVSRLAGAELGHEERLTARELEVADLLELPNKEIARRLSIQVTTVKNHVHSILDKLGVSRRADAAAVLHGRDPVLRARRI